MWVHVEDRVFVEGARPGVGHLLKAEHVGIGVEDRPHRALVIRVPDVEVRRQDSERSAFAVGRVTRRYLLSHGQTDRHRRWCREEDQHTLTTDEGCQRRRDRRRRDPREHHVGHHQRPGGVHGDVVRETHDESDARRDPGQRPELAAPPPSGSFDAGGGRRGEALGRRAPFFARARISHGRRFARDKPRRSRRAPARRVR